MSQSPAPSTPPAQSLVRGSRGASSRWTYLSESRDLVNSCIIVAPLFIFYQIGILFTDGWMNGADFVTTWMHRASGHNQWVYAAFNLVILGALLAFYFRRKASKQLSGRTWVLVVAESTLYAFFLGGLVVNLLLKLGVTPPGLSMVTLGPGAESSVFNAIVLSVGAGTYEELFFRVILMGAMIWGLERAGKFRTIVNVGIAVLVSSLIFSAFHYKPFGMDDWQMWSFMFRFVAGIIFAVLYMTRGFAVAVYTHAIYDIFILVPRALGW